MCCAKLPPAKQKGPSMSSLAGIWYFTHELGYYSFTRNHKLLTVISIRFQRYLEVPSTRPWVLPAVFHSFMVSPQWGGAAVANNPIPCTGELCSISTALQYPLQFQEFHKHTHTHTHTVDNAFKTVKSTVFLDFVHCFYSKKNCFRYWISSHPEAKGWRGTYCVVYETNSCSQWLDNLRQLLYCTYAHRILLVRR